MGFELVRDLLEGLVCLPRHDLEVRVRDSRCHRSTDARRQDDVELAGQDECRRGDLRKAIRRVVREAHVNLRLKGLDGLLVGEGQRLLDELTYRAVCVRARRVDPREEGFEEGALAGATSASQRQKLSWERQRASGRA